MRFRGGAESDEVDDAPLTEEQVMQKLNEIPTFVVMGKEGGFVALTLREGGRAISFFIEPEEAKAVLNMTREAHPEVEVQLVSVPLGNALKLCEESMQEGEAKEAFSSFDGHLRLQTSSQLLPSVQPQLKAMLAASGVGDDTPWQLPMFLCDQLSGGDILPIFLNPREIRSAWLRNDQKEEDLPEKFVMLDIRMIIADMQKPGKGLPWSKVTFIGAQGGAEFANELMAAMPKPAQE